MAAPPTVIVLAHGSQRRLLDLDIPKQMLPLCRGGPTIIGRTLRLVRQLAGAGVTRPMAPIIVVAPDTPAWQGVCQAAEAELLPLEYPGSCILDGLAQTTERWRPEGPCEADGGRWDIGKTVVLLGDVVYSPSALLKMLEDARPLLFFGSSDITVSTGELYGLAFHGTCRTALASVLAGIECRRGEARAAYTGYQPGHLRNLLWEILGRQRTNVFQPMPVSDVYEPILDYTTDVDVPADLEKIAKLGAELERTGQI